MVARAKTKPLFYKFTNPEIEALPEDIRDTLGLVAYYPPTQKELLSDWIDGLPYNTELNAKDVFYFFWKEHDIKLRLPDATKLLNDLAIAGRLTKEKVGGILTFVTHTIKVPARDPKKVFKL
jgi:hypothetical protein